MKFCFFLILLIPYLGKTQNLTGVWEGTGGGTTYIKLVVKHKKDSVFGYTSDRGGGYCTASFIGIYNKKTKKLTGRNVYMLENSGTHGPAKYNWTYSKEADGEYLRENSGNILDMILGIETSEQWLKRVSKKPELLKIQKPQTPKIEAPKPTPIEKKKPAEVKPPPKKPVPPIVKENIPKQPKPDDKITAKPDVQPAPPKPSELLIIKNERSSKVIQTIKTKESSIRILLYDNGEIDNDTVTVFFNNKVILEKFMITDKAKELIIPVSRNSENLIELFANNLGTIPPNTALLVIYAGEKRYELHASYDLKNNAGILVEYDPDF